MDEFSEINSSSVTLQVQVDEDFMVNYFEDRCEVTALENNS